MKKVEVRFNLWVEDEDTEKSVKAIIKQAMSWYSITNLKINNTEKRGKR